MTIIYPWVLYICLIDDLGIIHHQDIFISLEVTHGPWKHSIQNTACYHGSLSWHFPLWIWNSYILQSLLALYISRDVFGVMKKNIHVSDSLEFFFFCWKVGSMHFLSSRFGAFLCWYMVLSLPWICLPFSSLRPRSTILFSCWVTLLSWLITTDFKLPKFYL